MQQPLSRSNSPTNHELLPDKQHAVTLKQQHAQHKSAELEAYHQHLWQESLEDCAGNEAQARQLYDRIVNALTRHERYQEQQQQQQQAKHARQVSKSANNSHDASCSRNVCHQRKRHKVAAIVEAKVDHDSKMPQYDDATYVPRIPNVITLSNLDRAQPDELRDGSVSESSDNGADLDGAVSARCGLKWCKPGIVSKLVGVSHSVLRSWAKAKVVTTMVSSGGHRLFHLQSVRRHIAAALPATASATQHIKTPADEQQSAATFTAVDAGQQLSAVYQLLVYMRLTGASDDEARLNAMGESIKAQVLQRYRLVHTESNVDASLFILELDAVVDAEPGQQPQNEEEHGQRRPMNTSGMRRMLRTICEHGRPSRLRIVLRSSDDISPVPAAYAFFQLLCRCMGATIDIVPELPHLL